MADKRLDQENVLTDFDYALVVKGSDVAKISKADLASVVGGQMSNQGLRYIGYKFTYAAKGRTFKLFNNNASWVPKFAIVEGMVNENPVWLFVAYIQTGSVICKCYGISNINIKVYSDAQGAYLRVETDGLNPIINIRSCEPVTDLGIKDTQGLTIAPVTPFSAI